MILDFMDGDRLVAKVNCTGVPPLDSVVYVEDRTWQVTGHTFGFSYQHLSWKEQELWCQVALQPIYIDED